MADGDARLSVVLEAKIDKLTEKLSAANRAVSGASRRMQQDLDAANGRWAKLFGKTDPAKALDKVFDATRFRVLDTGAARIGLFGSALETLGPAGLAAAAAVGAVALAFAGARDAAKFADDINDTAARLHVTTDALQEYRYAIRAAGGEERGADEALEGFSITLGKAQQGLTKSQRAFLALGFSKEQIKGFKDADEALRAVTAKISGLGSNAQRDAIISQLGLDGLKPLIEQGADAMTRLRDEAHRLGIVMDAELVKRGGDLNDEFETVQKVIDVQLKSALVDLGPVLLDLLKLMAKLAKDAADVADAFKSIENRRTDHLKDQRQLFADRAAGPLGKVVPGLREHDLGRVAEIDAVLADRAKADVPPKLPNGGNSLIDTTPKPRDDSDQRIDAAKQALARSVQGELKAQEGLTESVDRRQQIDTQIADQELAGALAGLERQRADVNADAGISAAKKRTIGGLVDQAEDAERRSRELQQEKIDRDAARESFDQWAEAQQQIADNMDAVAQISADEAATIRERLSIELKALEDRQRRERLVQQENLQRQVQDGRIGQSTANTILQSGDERRAAERRDVVQRNAGALQEYLHSIQDLDAEFENAAVSAVRSLADGLADAVVNAKDLGDVASNVFRQLLAQILSAVAQKEIIGPILMAMGIPAFANGTLSAPGGMAIVGERGPELVNLPRGAQVIPNQALARLSSGAPGAAVTSVQQHFHNDFRGAVMTEDLVASLKGYTDRVGLQSAAAGADLAYQRTMRRLQQRSSNLLGSRR